MRSRAVEDVIARLREGKMLAYPPLAAILALARRTGDYARLMTYLERHPRLLRITDQNLALAQDLRADNPFHPAPTRQEAQEKLAGTLKLGLVNDSRSVWGLEPDLLCRLLIILGRVGSGKSLLAKSVVAQVLARDRSERGFNVLIPDLKREYRDLAGLGGRLKVLSLARFPWNFFQVPPWSRPRDYLVSLAETFTAANYLAITSANLFIELGLELYHSCGVLDGGRSFPTVRDFHALVEKRLAGTKTFRYADVLQYLLNRLRPYVLSPAFACRSGIPWELFRAEDLVIEFGDDFTDHMADFVVSHLVHQLYLANKAQGLAGARLRHLFVIDEARLLFQAHRDTAAFGEAMINQDITRVRDYGLGFIILSQETASLTQTLRTIAATIIAFPLLDAADIKFIKHSFGLSEDQAQHLFKMPSFGQAVCRSVALDRPFLLDTLPFRIDKRLTDPDLAPLMAGFWEELKRRIEAGERVETPSGQAEQAKAPDQDREILPPSAAALLYHLGRRPFATASELVQMAQMGPDLDKAQAWLVQRGYVVEASYRVSKTKPSKFLVLQDKALAYLHHPGLPGKGGYEHQLFQWVILRHLLSHGWKGKIEGQLGQGKRTVDVLGQSPDKRLVAFEVTLSFDNLLHNVREDLAAGAAEVVIVTRDKEGRDKAMGIVVGDGSLDPRLESLSFRTIDFFA